MRPEGQAEIDAAKADGRWDAAYAGPATITVPPDLQAALDQSPSAAAFFATLNSNNRFAILFRIGSVKRAETRARKIAQYVAMLEAGETMHPPVAPGWARPSVGGRQSASAVMVRPSPSSRAATSSTARSSCSASSARLQPMSTPSRSSSSCSIGPGVAEGDRRARRLRHRPGRRHRCRLGEPVVGRRGRATGGPRARLGAPARPRVRPPRPAGPGPPAPVRGRWSASTAAARRAGSRRSAPSTDASRGRRPRRGPRTTGSAARSPGPAAAPHGWPRPS